MELGDFRRCPEGTAETAADSQTEMKWGNVKCS